MGCMPFWEENHRSLEALSAAAPQPHLHVHGHVQAFAGRCSLLGFRLLLLQPLLLSQALLLFLGPEAASEVLETGCTCSPCPHANPRPGRELCPRSH